MPDDRLLHKRAGHSEKVSNLSDIEFRVWIQYQWSADDFGVMRLSAVNLQADNDALAEKSLRVVQRAFECVVAAELIFEFEHQGRRYVYQRDWQDFQKVEYPKPTVNPLPPPDHLALCTERTQALFDLHPGGKRLKKIPQDNAGSFDDNSPNLPVPVPDLARAGTRAVAMANGNGKRHTATAERFDRFWEACPKKVGKEAARKAFQKLNPDDALTDRMIQALGEQAQTPDWRKEGGRFIPYPSTWLNAGRWEDEVAVTPAVNQRPQGCRHQPPCVDDAACTKRQVAEARGMSA